MRIDFAHIRERTTTGHNVDFAVFNANATSGGDRGRAAVLADLTRRARLAGYKVDVSALVYEEHGQYKSYGDRIVVDYLQRGIPAWTHYLET